MLAIHQNKAFTYRLAGEPEANIIEQIVHGLAMLANLSLSPSGGKGPL